MRERQQRSVGRRDHSAGGQRRACQRCSGPETSGMGGSRLVTQRRKNDSYWLTADGWILNKLQPSLPLPSPHKLNSCKPLEGQLVKKRRLQRLIINSVCNGDTGVFNLSFYRCFDLSSSVSLCLCFPVFVSVSTIINHLQPPRQMLWDTFG